MRAQLETVVSDVAVLDVVPELLSDQIAALDAAQELRRHASRIEADMQEAICAQRTGECDAGGWSVEIRQSKRRSGWDDDGLVSDVRTYLTEGWHDDEIAEAVSKALDMVWHPEMGLCPLKGRNVRTTVLAEMFGIDADEYSRFETTKKATITRRPA